MASVSARLICATIIGAAPEGVHSSDSDSAFDQSVEAIVLRIEEPAFPDRVWPVTDFGACGDGCADDRPAVQKAIDRGSAAGGGMVLIPRGTWRLAGPLHLKSNVRLHLEEGSRLRFDTTDAARFLPVVLTRWEGTEVFNHSPFIYAYQAVNVAITGPGVIDGDSAETFATWREKQQADQLHLRALGSAGVSVHERVFGAGHFLRPPLIQFFACSRVLIDGPHLVDSPFWCVHLVASSQVIVRRLRIDCRRINNDGVDVESCTDVLIEDCVFNTADDCVALKSGRDADGWRIGRPTEHVVVRRCELNSHDFGSSFAIGSEMSAGVRHVYLQDCCMPLAVTALNFKSNLDRGGSIEDVQVRGVTADRVRDFIVFTTDYHGYRGGSFPPTFRNVRLADLTCGEARVGLSMVGRAEAPLRDVMLERVQVGRMEQPPVIRHIRGLRLAGVSIAGEELVLPPNID